MRYISTWCLVFADHEGREARNTGRLPMGALRDDLKLIRGAPLRGVIVEVAVRGFPSHRAEPPAILAGGWLMIGTS